jgi:cobalt-zinc-cadmium resistance protein CzcA
VFVGGLIVGLIMSIFLLPTLYVWMAGEHDVLPEPQTDFDEEV